MSELTKMNQPQPGDTFPIHMGWMLPGGNRIQVTVEVEVKGVELDKNRMLCQLLQIQAASGNRPESEIDPLYFAQVMGLIAKHALIPLEARQGIVLPLRLTTLTGEHQFFFD